MTAQKLILRPSGGRLAVHSFHFTDFHMCALRRCSRVHEGRGAPQVIGNDAEPDPPSSAVSASIAAAPQAMASFDDADAAFAPDAPAPIQRWRPQRRIGRPSIVHLVGRDDLMLRFLNRHELSEFRRFGDLAFPNRFRVRLEDAEHFIGYVDISAEQARTGLLEDARHEWPHLRQLLARAGQGRHPSPPRRCGGPG